MYKVRIDKFEGPFDLLIYLLENARMDIYDIKVAEITEQYIGYLKEMEELNVEVDTEFIVLAAVLIRLKSRMLLPRINEAGEIEIIEDPRLELRGRLLEYMRIKKAAELLMAAEEFNLNVSTCALNGGEDYELLFTVPLTANELVSAIEDVKVIGYITKPELGKALISRDGNEFELKAQGWNHMAEE